MERRFMALDKIFINRGLFDTRIPSGAEFVTEDGFDGFYAFIDGRIIYGIEDLIKYLKIVEILPDKKPISSEENTNIEEDIYSKKYNIYEILTLIPNIPKNTEFECSLDEDIWVISNDDLTLNKKGYCGFVLESVYSLKEILEATYTIVKPIEEVKEKWIRVSCNRSMCEQIVKGKTIRINGIIVEKDYTDSDIQNMFDNLEYGKVEYLEEN